MKIQAKVNVTVGIELGTLGMGYPSVDTMMKNATAEAKRQTVAALKAADLNPENEYHVMARVVEIRIVEEPPEN